MPARIEYYFHVNQHWSIDIEGMERGNANSIDTANQVIQLLKRRGTIRKTETGTIRAICTVRYDWRLECLRCNTEIAKMDPPWLFAVRTRPSQTKVSHWSPRQLCLHTSWTRKKPFNFVLQRVKSLLCCQLIHIFQKYISKKNP